MRPVTLAFQRDQIFVRGHQRQLPDVTDGVAGIDGDHDGLDLVDHVGQATAITFMQQALQIVLEKGGILFIAVAGEIERADHNDMDNQTMNNLHVQDAISTPLPE